MPSAISRFWVLILVRAARSTLSSVWRTSVKVANDVQADVVLIFFQTNVTGLAHCDNRACARCP